MMDLTFAERVPEGCAMMVVGVGAVGGVSFGYAFGCM